MEHSIEEKNKNSLFDYLANFLSEILYLLKKIFPFSHKKEKTKKNDYLTVGDKESELDYKYFEENSKYDTCYNNNNDNYLQIQIQASKQRLKQLESQTYSNRTMANMIAASELYALSVKCPNDQLYKKFDEFDNLKRKTKNELKGELIIQIECFKVSFKSYVKKYKKYDFPDDYDEERTLEELEMIKNKINKKDKKFYEAIINLLKGNTNIPSFDEELNELEEDKNNSDKKDPRLQIKTDIPIIRHAERIRKELKNNYLNDPMNCKVRLNLDQPLEKDEELLQIAKDLDKMKKEEKIYKGKRLNRCGSAESLSNTKYKIEEKKNEKKHERNKSIEKLTIKIKKELEIYFNENELNNSHHSKNYSCHCDDCDIYSEEDMK